jgi:thiamine biosynthesis lipoprotein
MVDMRETRDIMGMPVTVEAVGGRTLAGQAAQKDIDAVFSYFASVDRRFSTYKEDSEISRLNRGNTAKRSREMQEILRLAEKTHRESGGYFDIRRPDGRIDPSGVVKGWAILNAAKMLRERGIENFFIDAGGDIQSQGVNAEGKEWTVGIRSPFAHDEIVKVLVPRGAGVATSGSYLRGNHIYDPVAGKPLEEIVSLTVIGPDILEADRFATAAFAMGRRGIAFVESTPLLEGYAIDRDGVATMTSGFEAYVAS